MSLRKGRRLSKFECNSALRFALILVLLWSATGPAVKIPMASAVEEGGDPRVIVLDASTDDLQGYIRKPWAVTESQIRSGDKQPFMRWEESKEGDTTFYAGWMNHYARLDREQLDLEGVRDDASLQLAFDAEQLTIRGSLNAHVVTAFKWPCRYISGEFATYGCPDDYGDSVMEALCEAGSRGTSTYPSWRTTRTAGPSEPTSP